MFNLDHLSWDWDGDVAALRATQLASAAINTTTPTTVYTVPTGKRAIVKQIVAQNTTGTSKDLQFRLPVLGTVLHWVLAAYGTGADRVVQNVWIVLNAGDTIKLNTVVAGLVNVVISGSEHTV